VKVSALPMSEKTIQNLLAKGWVEQHGAGNALAYRITGKGLAAKKTPVRVYP
jgi:chromosome segregation and condensation protein ScpB